MELREKADVECDSETCIFNPNGICLAPLVTGHATDLDEDGCRDWRPKEW